MVKLGIKAGRSIQRVSLPVNSKAARPQMFETLPATRIRRTGLRTSGQQQGQLSVSGNPSWTEPGKDLVDRHLLFSRWLTSPKEFCAGY